MQKPSWTLLFAVAALVASASPAEAGWVSCPGTGLGREFKLNTSPQTATCYMSGIEDGTHNVNGNNDTINQDGWITLDKSDDGSTGALLGALQITGQGTTQGTFTIINPLAWATYSSLLIVFKSGNGQETPSWAAFMLPTGETSGSWKITGRQALSHANLYGRINGTPPPLPAVPEPATLALLGTGFATLGWRRRRSQARERTNRIRRGMGVL